MTVALATMNLPLHIYFSSLPILQGACVPIVQDNPRGLTRKCSASEKKRMIEARRARINEEICCHSPTEGGSISIGTSTARLSRWESELPDLLVYTQSPPAPQKGQMNEKEVEVTSARSGIEAPPKLPRRRTSTEGTIHCDLDCNIVLEMICEPEDTSHSRSSSSSGSSHSSRSSASKDFPLEIPQRRTSALSWPDAFEVNTALEFDCNVPESRLMPQSRLTLNSRDAMADPAQIKKGSVSGRKPVEYDTTTKHAIKESRRSNRKNAPRRPRRMKSIEMDGNNEESHANSKSINIETTIMEESSNGAVDPQRRLELSETINSVVGLMNQGSILDQLEGTYQGQPSYNTLTSREQIFFNDAVKGVVGALSRSSHDEESQG